MSGRSSDRRDRDRPRGRVQRRVSSLDDLLGSTGRLALQTARRVGTDSACRSLGFFASRAVRQDLVTAWADWQRTSRFPPAERPPIRPQPSRGARLGFYLFRGSRSAGPC